jgi:two-component system, NtrC family, response regulator AtoC
MAHIEKKLDELLPDIMRFSGEKTHANVIDLVEKALIAKVLKQCGHNQVKAARLLGISRNTLRHRMKKFHCPSSGNAPERPAEPGRESD